MKRFIATLLITLMFISIFPIVTFAAEEEKYLLNFTFDSNINGWEQGQGYSCHGTDPLDPDNGVHEYYSTATSQKWVNARAFFDDTKDDDKIFTGRVMLTALNSVSYDYRLRGNANESLVAFWSNGSIRVRDTNTGLTWVPNCWVSFSVFVEYSAEDKTTCKVNACLSSENGMKNADGEVVKTYTVFDKTINMTGYEANFGATGKSRNSINAQAVLPANTQEKVYMDDVNVIINKAPVASKVSDDTSLEFIKELEVSFNHMMNVETLKGDNFILTANDGTIYKPTGAISDLLKADKVKLTFNPIDISGNYELSMNNVTDIAGENVSNKLSYTVENAGSNPITGLDIVTDNKLEQTYLSTEAVTFKANTTPATGVAMSSITWYVNNEKQDVIGGEFTYMPTESGKYTVQAIVNNTDVKSNELVIDVNKADPEISWPTISVIYQGNKFADALNNDGVGSGVFTIEDADVLPDIKSDGYTKKLIFTPNDTKNYNTLYKNVIIIVNEPSDIVYDTVTISTKADTTVKLSEIDEVEFIADAQPKIGPDPNSVLWYVNGEKQSYKGLNFKFTPDKVGSYYISATVDGNPSANVKNMFYNVIPDEIAASSDVVYIDDNFTAGDLNKWSNVSGKEDGSGVRVSPAPDDSNNNVADYYASEKGSTFIGMRKVMDAANPLVMSGRLMLYGEPEDNGAYAGRSFTILMRSMVDGYGSNILIAFNHDKSIVMGGKRVGTWIDNQWIDFTVCLVPNGSDPTNCMVAGTFNGALNNNGEEVPFYDFSVVDYSNFAFDDPQIQFNSVIKANKEGRNHVYLDDFKGFSVNKLEPILPNNVNIGSVNSLMLLYNHQINPETVVLNNISVYDVTADKPVDLDEVYIDESNPIYSSLLFSENLVPDRIYRIDFDEKLKDIADCSSCYKSIFFSTGNDTPPQPVKSEIKVNRISVYPEYFELPLGFTLPCELAVSVTPDSADNKTLEWVSDNENVATVKDGIITGVSLGEAKIQAFATDGSGVKSNEITVKITESRVAADNQKINLGKGSNRIDIEKHLSMPENIGDAQVALWADDKTGAVTITVDDCITGDFPQWKKWTEDYGFQFTMFVPTNSYGTSGWPKEILEDLIASGEDVQSHSYHHYSNTVINGLSSAQSILEFKQPIEAINSLEGGACKTIAYSYGTGDPDYASQFYIACRGVVTLRLNPADATDYTYISSISMDGSQNITEDYNGQVSLESAIKSLYDKNYKYRNTSYYGGWTSFHTHGLGLVREGEIIPDQGGLTTAESYQYIFDNYMYPAKDKLWVGKFSEVAMYAQERDTATLTVLSADSNSIKYELTDMMDDNLFDFPLSVKIKVDPNWKGITATQNGKDLEFTEIVDGTNKYIMVKTVPDKGIVTVAHTNTVEVDESIIEGIKCIVDDGLLTFTSDKTENIYAYIATYNESVVTHVDAYIIELTKDTPEPFNYVLPTNAKLFVWNEGMRPVILPIKK